MSYSIILVGAYLSGITATVAAGGESMQYTLLDSTITQTVTKFPFFAPGILHLPCSENKEIPTARTDGTRIEFNPDFLKSLTPGQRVFLLLHEWTHVMMYHPLERGDRNPELWNIAIDYCVNGFLYETLQAMTRNNQNPPFEWIKGALLDKRFFGLTGHQIYDILMKENPPTEQQVAASGMGECTDHPDPNANRQGSPEQEEAKDEIKAYVMAGAQSAKLAGKLSEELERQLGLLVEPKTDWKSELAVFIQSRVKDDYSFMRRNLRFSGSNVIMPALYSEAIDTLAFMGDASGSISEDELREITSDTVSAFDSVPIKELIFIWFDSEVCGEPERFYKGEEINLHPKGGGGTDFEPPFRWLEEHDIQPCGAVVLTDGYCDDFAPEPPYEVLWCVYGGNKSFSPPYGRVIQVEF